VVRPVCLRGQPARPARRALTSIPGPDTIAAAAGAEVGTKPFRTVEPIEPRPPGAGVTLTGARGVDDPRPSNEILRIEQVRDPGSMRVVLRGELDVFSARSAERAIEAAAAAAGSLPLTLDLRGLYACAPVGLAVFYRALHRAQASKRSFILLTSPAVRALFEEEARDPV